METTIHKMAVALRAAAAGFESPVYCYVEPEAARRFNEAHPEQDALIDHPGIDWGLESWKILARAVLPAIREPTEAMGKAGRGEDPLDDPDPPEITWTTMIDAAIKEGLPRRTSP